MLVLSNALAGSGRDRIEDAVVRLANKERHKVVRINLIDEIVDIGREHISKDLDPPKLLNLDTKTLNSIKSFAFERIKRRIEESKGIDYILDSHASFWWKNSAINLTTIKDIRFLNPDLIVTLYASPNEVYANLIKRKEWQGKGIDELEIAIWQSQEVYTADIIASELGKQNYLIGSREDPQTLLDLIYHRDKPKVYVSFAMSHRKEGYEKLDRFVKRLRKHCIVFDPRSVDIMAYKVSGDKRLKDYIFNNTVKRDYHFIDQSDMVVVYLQELAYSSGVDSERIYAYTEGKPVLFYFPFKHYSPFTPYYADKMFEDENKLIRYIEQNQTKAQKQ